MLKKILKITGITLLVFILAAIAVPFIFKDKIIALVKVEANKNLNASLAFDDLDISLFSSFPKLSIELEGLSIVGKDVFKNDTLIKAKNLGVSTGLMGLFADEISISRVWIDQAKIHVRVLKDGRANWDIAKSDSAEVAGTAEKPSAFKAKLQGYSIENSQIIYDDLSLGFYTKLVGLNHEGSGDFTADQTNLVTKTTIDSLDLAYAGVNYLSKVKISYDAQFALDLKNSKYSFLENELQVNDLFLKFSGLVSMPKEDIEIDIKYEALKNEVKSFLSLVPGSFTADFKDVKSSGKLAFNGFVKGIYNDNSIPGFALNLTVENGKVQYPSLPRALSNMQIACAITCPGVDADRTVVNLSKFHVDLGQFPIDARLLLKTPISDPDIDASISGQVDLTTLKDVMPIEDGMKLSGLVAADASFAGKVSSIEKQQYESFKASGKASLQNFTFVSSDLPNTIRIPEAQMSFNPKSIELSKFIMLIDKSDLNATGSLSNYLTYVLKDDAIKGNLNVSSSYFNLNPFMTTATAPPAESKEQPADVNGYIRIPENIDFTINASFKKLIYDNLELNDLKGQLVMVDQEVKMNNVSMNTLGGSIIMGGFYNTKNEAGPSVALQISMNSMNIKQTARAFNSVKQLAPIAENTTGTMNVKNFNFSCKADKEFNPDMKTVNGSGQISTSVLEIEGFEMIKKIASSLKIDKLKKWKLEPLNAVFSIVNGTVTVKPFKTKLGNIPVEIGGENGLDQTIRYAMNFEIPRAEFGGAANSVLTSMIAKAKSAGVSADPGEIIPVTVLVTGTFKDPKVSTDIKSLASNAMNDLKDQAEAKLREEADRRKKELEDKVNAEKDRIKKEAEDQINAQKDKLKSEADKAKAEAERKAKEEADKAKKKLEDEAKKGLNNILKKK